MLSCCYKSLPMVVPQVVYCRQGHELYRDAVRENKAYPWKHPWEKFTLRVSQIVLAREGALAVSH